MNQIQVAPRTALMARTADIIAGEINGIKGQMRQVMLSASIEIGRRLVEAKSLLDHGEWGNWLETQVEYSPSTANNLMRLFDAYGADQITLLDNNVRSKAFESLSYSKAVALLGVPDEDREAFVAANDVESMSTRELQRAIKERDEAVRRQQESEADAAELSAAAEEARVRAKALSVETDAMRKELADLKAQGKSIHSAETQKAKDEAKKARSEADDLRRRLAAAEAAKPIAVHSGATDEDIAAERAKAVEEYASRLAEANARAEAAEKRAADVQERMARQANTHVAKYEVLFECVVKDFGQLLGCLAAIKPIDEETHARYLRATKGLLDKMQANAV